MKYILLKDKSINVEDLNKARYMGITLCFINRPHLSQILYKMMKIKIIKCRCQDRKIPNKLSGHSGLNVKQPRYSSAPLNASLMLFDCS